jgi:hypothetical protein
LQVCNYVSLTTLGTYNWAFIVKTELMSAWETIDTCTSVCEITESGSVDCE